MNTEAGQSPQQESLYNTSGPAPHFPHQGQGAKEEYHEALDSKQGADIENVISQDPGYLINVDVGEPPAERQELIMEAITFSQRLSQNFKNEMNTLMRRYQDEHPDLFTEDIKNKMIERGYDLPEIDVLDSQAATQFLQQDDFGRSELYDDEVLVVLNLPIPLARYWYRGGTNSWGDLSIEIPENRIEWGRFYREVMPVVWDNLGYEECEGNLSFSRINDLGQHDPKSYYYIWAVRRLPDPTVTEP